MLYKINVDSDKRTLFSGGTSTDLHDYALGGPLQNPEMDGTRSSSTPVILSLNFGEIQGLIQSGPIQDLLIPALACT